MTDIIITYDEAEIRRFVSILPPGTYEVRALNTSKATKSGYFNHDLAGIIPAAVALSGKVPAVYLTINRVNPDLILRANNRIIDYAKYTTADKDIIRRDWLPIDLDAVRPEGISSTDSEHQAALDLAFKVAEYLQLQGISKDSFVVADSGNGAHVLIRLDLPADNASRDLCQAVLKALDAKFPNDGRAYVDQTTFNAARIIKLYGTQVKKGDPSPERPHRVAKLLQVPDAIAPADASFLQRIAEGVPKPAERGPYSGRSQNVDIRVYLSKHGLEVRREKQLADGTLFELAVCPFNPEHNRGEASITQFSSGAVVFNCKHNSCEGKEWRDLRALYPLDALNNVPSNNSFKEGGYRGESLDVEAKPSNTVRPVKDRQETSKTRLTSDDIKRRLYESCGKWIYVRDLDNDLNIRESSDKHLRRQVIYQLVKDGLVERDPLLDNKIRFVNAQAGKISLSLDNLTGALPIKFPFQIQNKVNLYPRNIAVIAGSQNAGKTAFLLNIARMNRDAFNIVYFSSEMAEQELTERLVNFGEGLEPWQKVDFRERSHDFADVIRPDDFNIVDYIELNVNIYEIGGMLEAIYNRLKSGIAIVAIQKKVGATFGRGQEFSAEKPRLYLSMDSHKLTIVKGKNWHDKTDNPNHQSVSFKIVKGCEFIQDGPWMKGSD